MMNKFSFQINSPILRLERLDMLGSLENDLFITIRSLRKSKVFKNWIAFSNNLIFSLFYGLLGVFLIEKNQLNVV